MHLSARLPHQVVLVARRLCPALAIASALAVCAFSVGSASQARAASTELRYQRGYYLQDAYGTRWLCYGWANGIYHCTMHWHVSSGGALVSDNVAWVPNNIGDPVAPASGTVRTPAHVSRTHVSRPPATRPAPSGGGSVQNQIRQVFGPFAGAALAVAACESGYNPSSYNPSSGASGVFQFLASTWATTSYAGYSRFNAWANIHAAYQVFSRDGYSWREWSCKP